jgi:hypothetical protein
MILFLETKKEYDGKVGNKPLIGMDPQNQLII